jgi:hypothetical protein
MTDVHAGCRNSRLRAALSSRAGRAAIKTPVSAAAKKNLVNDPGSTEIDVFSSDMGQILPFWSSIQYVCSLGVMPMRNQMTALSLLRDYHSLAVQRRPGFQAE